ncbi:LPP20 family lipoprotein [Marinobacter sp. M1N3S26]|uniref:LPP20 family lipoprotein n=1 Tax=unclassified Marinobacter TaxID=83889 RepID=UPI00387B0D82
MKSSCIALLLIVALSGCASNSQYEGQSQNGSDNFEPIIVRVSGYGTYEHVATDRPNPRKRLMARRASQLDAYRNLAERVYGTVIYGSSTVSDFVAHSDMFRTYVDSYLRGAKLVDIQEHDDGVIETVMELKLERRFRECVSRVSDRDVSGYCPDPLPTGDGATGDVVSNGSDSLYYLD